MKCFYHQYVAVELGKSVVERQQRYFSFFALFLANKNRFQFEIMG